MTRKKVVFLILIIALLLFVSMVFLFRYQIGSYLEYREISRMFALPDDYIIYETSDGKFIKSEKDGLKVMIPEGWEVIKGVDMPSF